jgi:hypothetical protein
MADEPKGGADEYAPGKLSYRQWKVKPSSEGKATRDDSDMMPVIDPPPMSAHTVPKNMNYFREDDGKK